MTNPYVGPPHGTVSETAAAGFAAIAQGKANPSDTFQPLLDSIKANEAALTPAGSPQDGSGAPGGPGAPTTFPPVGKGGGKVERQAAALVRKYLGVQYTWGGTTPQGFDCSGLLQYIYRSLGVNIPRTTYDQWDAGTPIAASDLQPGDAVFFVGGDPKNGKPGHVGIYIGNGMMIDAPHPGSVVRLDSVSKFGGYQGARRFG